MSLTVSDIYDREIRKEAPEGVGELDKKAKYTWLHKVGVLGGFLDIIGIDINNNSFLRFRRAYKKYRYRFMKE